MISALLSLLSYWFLFSFQSFAENNVQQILNATILCLTHSLICATYSITHLRHQGNKAKYLPIISHIMLVFDIMTCFPNILALLGSAWQVDQNVTFWNVQGVFWWGGLVGDICIKDRINSWVSLQVRGEGRTGRCIKLRL